MKRSARDNEILTTLAVKVRFLSLSQIARGWWTKTAEPEIHARRRLSEFREARLLSETVVPASPMLDLQAPVVVWKLGQPAPDFAAVAHTLLNRWPPTPTVRTSVYAATERTNNMYGGPSSVRPIHLMQLDHDLHVGEVYLRYLRDHSALAERWVGEDIRPKSGYRLKDPDAVLEFDGGARIHVVEFGGRYDTDRVRDFHNDCAQRERSYEIW